VRYHIDLLRPGFAYFGPEGAAGPPVLHCDAALVANLARKYSTPLYVYSGSAIKSRLHAFDAAFASSPHTICYSVKANSNLSILRLMAREGCGFDVVSGGELGRVLAASRKSARQVVFSGVGKTPAEMTAALDAGILLFNVESESELYALAECAAGEKKSARIAMRVNPDVRAETHPYISTGLHQHKFGVPIPTALRLYEAAASMPYLQVAGVSVHIGSQITDVEPFRECMERVAELVCTLRMQGHDIRYVDAGGGLGIPYETSADCSEKAFTHCAKQYAQAIMQPLRKLGVHVLLEPGRSIVGPAGVLLTSVIYRKTNHGKSFLVVDAAMNDLIRPSLYGAHHEIVPVACAANSSPQETVDIVGPVCETGDFFARNRSMPVTQEGGLLAILDAGAYGMVLASNYNTRPRPAEVLVKGKSAKLIRRREKLDDLLRAEILSDVLIAESRISEKGIPLQQVKADLVKRGRLRR
jgi:diaminopimelate decarboxylase